LVVVYVIVTNLVLLHTVRNPELAKKMREKDQRQYIEIARDFAAGDFSMSYVQTMPHRQPLYPALLAVPVRIWGDDLYKMGWVNVLAGLALLLCLYSGVLRLFDSITVAVLTCAAYLGNPFMIDKISARLMTEVLHALCLVVLILLFLAYLRDGRARYLIAAAATAGLDYLARTNGLFVMASMVVTLVCHDVWQLCRPRPATAPGSSASSEPAAAPASSSRWSLARTRLLGYLGAGVMFLIAAAPSWVPRERYFGKPFFHGYLANYMWTDTYEQAHTGQVDVAFTWQDYVQGHDWRGFLARWGHGFHRVYWEIPTHDKYARILYYVAIAGLVMTFVKRRWEYALLGAFLFIQLLPIVWTVLANPGPRISYGTFFPFELFFAALALSYLVPLVSQGITSRMKPRPAAEP
jgi:hypothetical protein